MTDFYRLGDAVCSRSEVRDRDISLFRVLSLGDFENRAAAREAMRGLWDAPAVIDHNVRIAVERDIGPYFGLSHQQVGRLRAGETLTIADGLGRFRIAYLPLSDEAGTSGRSSKEFE